MRASLAVVSLLAAAGVAGWAACLPPDTRPQPGHLLVTVGAAAHNQSGLPAFDDGWTVTFDRVLVSMGGGTIGGSGCTSYTDAFYRRLYDAQAAVFAGKQKLVELYGLGTCDLGFRVSSPDDTSILMAGVTPADPVLMRAPGGDAFVKSGAMSMFVKGSATRAGVTKTFTWPFRERRVVYGGCAPLPGAPAEQLSLDGDSQLQVDLVIDAAALFQDHLDPSKAKLHFQPYADADTKGDGNGDVTLDELAKVSLADAAVTVDPPAVDAGVPPPPDAGVESWKTLADYVYLGLFPRMVRLGEEGTCGVSIAPPRNN